MGMVAPTDIRTAQIMTTSPEQSLYKLQTWFSPSYPVGAYTYSHGLEQAFETGLIDSLDQATDWISDIITGGNGFADAVFVCEAHRATGKEDDDRLAILSEYAVAFCGTKELRLESEAQGAAFIDVVQKVEPNGGLEKLTQIWSGPFPYCIAIGAAAGYLGIDLKATTTAYLHAFVSNLSSALVRIVPYGQTDGQRIIATLAPVVEEAVQKALTTNFEDISTSTLMVDLTSMQHENQYTRLFRS